MLDEIKDNLRWVLIPVVVLICGLCVIGGGGLGLVLARQGVIPSSQEVEPEVALVEELGDAALELDVDIEATLTATASMMVEDLPTETPTVEPTEEPTVTPTDEPTATPLPTETPTIVPTPTPDVPVVAGPGDFDFELSVSIDRSAVPDLYYNDLTLQTYVGGVDSVLVTADEVELETMYDPETGYVQYTTEAAEVQIVVEGGVDAPELGSTEKLILKDGKQWAWSHGFDDNVFLNAAIDLFKEKEWRATLYLIADEVEDGRDEDWVTDAPGIRRLLADGWSIGSHGWLNDCTDTTEAFMQQSFDRLEEIVATSEVPDYKVIGFSSPCFLTEYHPIILGMRDSGAADVQFNESQDLFLKAFDAPGGEEFGDDDHTAYPLDLDQPIGRDFRLEFESFELVQAEYDWVAEQGAQGRPIWYNTGSHGDHEDSIEEILDYLYSTYGPDGDESLWVAPADEIVSYVLVKDRSVVTVSDLIATEE